MFPSNPTRNAIYVTNALDAWLRVVREFRDREGIKPMMWLGCPDSKVAAAEFSGCIFPQYRILYKNGWQILSADAKYGLHRHVTNDLTPYWDELISMAPRSNLKQLAYHQVRHRIYGVYAYHIWFLKEHNIGTVFLLETPHKLSSYLLYIAARSLGIATPMFVRTSLPGCIFLTDRIGGTPWNFAETMNDMSVKSARRLLAGAPQIAEYLTGLQENSARENIPHYMKRQMSEDNRWLNRVARSRGMDRVGGLARLYLELRHAYKCLKYPFSEKSALLREIRNFYSSHAVSVPQRPYILVALHFQPERTTNPEGGPFDDQLLMIRLLASLAPKGWIIAVKEHSTQFRDSTSGDMGRSLEFYEGLIGIPNVALMPVDALGAELMLDAKAVATVTGTIGFEAAVKGIPVLSFGKPWYSDCPGVTVIHTAEDVTARLAKLESSDQDPDSLNDSLERYVASMIKTGLRGYIHTHDREFSGVGDDELADNMSGALRDYLSAKNSSRSISSVSQHS